MFTTADRWQRLADQVQTDAGIPVKVDAYSYPGGTSYSITHRLPGGDTVEVHDKWWSKNGDVWIGYQVHVQGGRDSLVKRTWPVTKKRSEVTAAIRQAHV